MATSALVNKLHVKDISWHGMAHFCTGRHSPGFQHCLENRSQPIFFPELCSDTAWEVLVGLNQTQARAVPAVESRDGHAPLIGPWSCLIYLHNDEYYTGTSAPQFFLELLLPTHPRSQFARLTLIDHSLPEVSCCTCIFLRLQQSSRTLPRQDIWGCLTLTFTILFSSPRGLQDFQDWRYYISTLQASKSDL